MATTTTWPRTIPPGIWYYETDDDENADKDDYGAADDDNHLCLQTQDTPQHFRIERNAVRYQQINRNDWRQ